ncbi:ATP-binding protein [Candidatus Woesearchaeota archaeon]|nr:ATP-binding protein [Candidatus Woesearchaeota archaeon]MCF7901341.1 ATP-binding protein [Candidatus Woesearchaeota archaeon]MCF8014038.1 ATP-binding protein [Candidatus Woesearchaeota archaeon]
MILGRIIGKTNTNEFSFLADKQIKKFEYVQVYHETYDYILCQILEIVKDSDRTVADCIVIGHKENGIVKKPLMPLSSGSEVLLAEDDFIRDIIRLVDSDSGAFIGKLDGKDIDVFLDLNKILTMHMSVLAKSGSGKSYAVGVLLEEMLGRNLPLVIIDPHGEYSSLKFKNDDSSDIEKLALFNLKPKSFEVQEFGDPSVVEGVRPLKLPKTLSRDELMSMFPGKLSNSQLAVLYSAMKQTYEFSFESLLLALEQEENNAKFGVMTLVDSLRSTGIFSDYPVSYNELVSNGKASILNLKGISTDVQELIVYKICKDLFELRKKGKLPPFFLVIEEAHNFCPERSFGETKASKLIRNIASEGRKFGLGLCVVSQRPARVDKSVLSQCSTQLILKVTNPNDLKALSSSVEGLTSNAEKEIQNIPIGSALVTGLTEVPLFVNIRPRMSMHGGRAEKIIGGSEDNFLDKIKEFSSKEILPLIKPNTSLSDLALMSDKPIEDFSVSLIPCYQFICKDNDEEFKLVVEMINGRIVVDKETFSLKRLPDMSLLSKKQISILKFGFKNKSFSSVDLVNGLGSNLDIDEDLKGLLDLEYLIEENDLFVLNPNFVFSKLSNFKNFDKVVHEQISFDSKSEENVNFDELVELISRFTTIIDKNKCFLVVYD